jgi:hypothetical protein
MSSSALSNSSPNSQSIWTSPPVLIVSGLAATAAVAGGIAAIPRSNSTQAKKSAVTPNTVTPAPANVNLNGDTIHASQEKTKDNHAQFIRENATGEHSDKTGGDDNASEGNKQVASSESFASKAPVARSFFAPFGKQRGRSEPPIEQLSEQGRDASSDRTKSSRKSPAETVEIKSAKSPSECNENEVGSDIDYRKLTEKAQEKVEQWNVEDSDPGEEREPLLSSPANFVKTDDGISPSDSASISYKNRSHLSLVDETNHHTTMPPLTSIVSSSRVK